MDKVSKEDRQLFQNTVDSAHLPDKDRAKLTTSAKKQPPFCKYSVATRGSIGSAEVVNFAKNSICEKTSKKMCMCVALTTLRNSDMSPCSMLVACLEATSIGPC